MQCMVSSVCGMYSDHSWLVDVLTCSIVVTPLLRLNGRIASHPVVCLACTCFAGILILCVPFCN